MASNYIFSCSEIKESLDSIEVIQMILIRYKIAEANEVHL